MTVNTFTEGMLRTFFRRSFRKLKKQGIRSLVIDIRSNGGGHISLSTLLTRYITDKPFTIADTVYAKARSLRPYSRYIRNRLIYNTAMFFVSSKKKDGLFHARYMEKKKFRPKKTHHFNGDTYVLTAGADLFRGRFIFQYGKRTTKRNTGGGRNRRRLAR
ncbi:MAG: S41 family peptidase [Ferruginibacter sp.]